MRLSTKARYGTRAMVELALTYPDAAVSAGRIAEAQRLSRKYLEGIMAILKAAGLVKAVRGLHGGYTLARPPAEIKISAVVTALEGPLVLADCTVDPGSCPVSIGCPMRELWIKMQCALNDILEGTTLRDLVKRGKRAKRSSASRRKT